jgi:hypothetical protein
MRHEEGTGFWTPAQGRKMRGVQNDSAWCSAMRRRELRTTLRTDPPILAATSRSRDTTEIRAWKIRDREVAASKIVGLVFE